MLLLLTCVEYKYTDPIRPLWSNPILYMMIRRDYLFAYLLILIMSFVKASPSDGNGFGYADCETVYTTVTAPASSTFTYTTTEIVPAGSAGVVTKYVNKPRTIAIETSTVQGTRTISLLSTTTKYVGATTTKVSTVTYTTFPNATTTIFATEKVVVFVKGTLTTTYPTPVISVYTLSRYTGAPTSLWLSVI